MLVDNILTSIKVKSGFPDDNYFTDSEMLTILNDEMKTEITPLLMKLQEEFFVQSKDYTISSTNAYRFPKRNIGNKLRDVKLVDGTRFTNLNRLFEEDRASTDSGYFISRNTLSLSDDITTGTLRVSYFLAPSTLVLSTACAQVLTIDSATQITVSSLPSTFALTTPVDFVQAVGPNDLLAIDQTIASIAGTTLTFASLSSDLAVGDYICLAGQSCIPVVPEELHPVLVQAALVSCLGSKKDKSAENESKKLQNMKVTMVDLLDTRVESPDIFAKSQGMLTAIQSRR
jgi:hypothetical protein